MNEPLLTGLARAALSSFVGTWGFALLLNAPKRAWLPAAAIDAVGYVLYWLLLRLGAGEPSAIFVAAMTASVLAQFCARKMRMIATIFVSLSIVSLVPGLGLYRCMELIGQGQNAAGLQAGALAMISILMIALGLAVGSFLFRVLFPKTRPSKCKEGVSR